MVHELLSHHTLNVLVTKGPSSGQVTQVSKIHLPLATAAVVIIACAHYCDHSSRPATSPGVSGEAKLLLSPASGAVAATATTTGKRIVAAMHVII